MLAFGHNEHRLLTSAKVPRQGLRLLELEPGVLEEIQNGRQACSEQLADYAWAAHLQVKLTVHSVVIKGAANAEAVLCTDHHTYALKIVETTNSLLLIPPDQVTDPAHASSVCSRPCT